MSPRALAPAPQVSEERDARQLLALPQPVFPQPQAVSLEFRAPQRFPVLVEAESLVSVDWRFLRAGKVCWESFEFRIAPIRRV